MVAQIITISLGIIIPRLVLVNLGSESNGLLSSVGSILSYLSLLEAGVGTATVQALYNPLAKEDKDSINSILSATHYYYRRTGLIYLSIVALISVFYTLFIRTGLPRIYVFLVVVLSGISSVLSFFFQGKYRLLLMAEGKGYIQTNLSTITNVCVSLTKAIVLIAGGNVVAVQSVYFIYNLVQVVFFVWYMKKHYTWINLNCEADFQAISQKNAVLIHEISSLVFYHTDTVILTVLTSLKVVSVYSMYAMIFGMVKSVAVNFTDSYIFALGQTYSERDRFLRIYNAYEVFSLTITFSLYCIVGILIIPFLKLYTRGITDINYLDPLVAFLFFVYYLMDTGRKSAGILINIAQHFEQTKWHSIIEASINLLVSILLTAKLGIYGVLIGTVAALLYRANDMIIYAARIIKRSPFITYRRWGRNIVMAVFFVMLGYYIPIKINNYFDFFIGGTLLLFIILPSFFIMNAYFEPQSARYICEVAKNTLRKK